MGAPKGAFENTSRFRPVQALISANAFGLHSFVRELLFEARCFDGTLCKQMKLALSAADNRYYKMDHEISTPPK
jgi:hypothetical protein